MQASPQLMPAIKAIGQAMDARFERLLPVPGDPRKRLIDAMRHATIAGGKRMRPLLAVSACELYNIDRERALRVGLAVECIHCYSLVHDDLPCMDDDDLRRGKPTVHKAFDEATAVLAGDGLLTLAFEVLADEATHEDPYVRLELVAELAKASGIAGMVGGQAMDLAAETSEFDLHTTTRLQQLKTGALISWSVEAGGIMGKASPDHRKRLRAYAHDLGLAFQIADDILDVEGDPEKTGKKTQKDADRKKATFVSLMGLDRAKVQALHLVDQAIGHLNVFGAEADLLRAIARFTVERDS
jgi:farnesyl diphosphate synthase